MLKVIALSSAKSGSAKTAEICIMIQLNNHTKEIKSKDLEILASTL